MDADSESFAIQAAKNGSEQAWRQLFERHFEAVESLLRRARAGFAREYEQIRALD